MVVTEFFLDDTQLGEPVGEHAAAARPQIIKPIFSTAEANRSNQPENILKEKGKSAQAHYDKY